MTKKIIILVLIFLIVINTIYWLYVTIRVFGYDEWVKEGVKIWIMRRKVLKDEYRKFPKKEVGKGEIDWGGYEVDVDKLTTKQKEEFQKIQEEIDKLDEEFSRSRGRFINRMISNFTESNFYTIPLLILAITDIVLIAISFMIILLYKNK